jgi:protein O-mannosyl-transferase
VSIAPSHIRQQTQVTARARAALAVVTVLAVTGYLNALQNPFAYDDTREVVANASLADLANLGAIVRHNATRPIVNLSYAIDYAFWGLNPVGYHLTNIVLHAGNVALFFAFVVFLAERATLAPRAERMNVTTAFVAAGLFAVHPMMTEAVAYVSGRSEVLVAVLMLASLHCLCRGLESQGAQHLLPGVGLFAAALGTKETAAMLPLILIAYDRLVLRGPDHGRRWRWQRVHLPLLGVIAFGAAVRIWWYVQVENPASAHWQWDRLFLELHVTARYLALLVAPLSQSLVHPASPIPTFFDLRVVTATAVLGMLVSGSLALRHRQPLFPFGVVWFFLFLIPSAGLMVLADRGEAMAEHRVYFASCGLFVAAAALVARSGTWVADGGARARRVFALITVVLAVLLAMTIARNNIWSDPVRLWEDAARKAPATYIAHYGVGDAYRSIGDCEAAEPAYEYAIALRPDAIEAYLGLASCLGELGRMDDARRVLRGALSTAPPHSQAVLLLAQIEEQRRNVAEAHRLCQQASALEPQNAAAIECVRRTAPQLAPP